MNRDNIVTAYGVWVCNKNGIVKFWVPESYQKGLTKKYSYNLFIFIVFLAYIVSNISPSATPLSSALPDPK